ncbi:helix-turn-helix transcriptional regulator [Clostridiaceae bacterium M8S5]|nr:helix-turn-helix transcriptional regulator [Clostridiaceae bacterium M8S5]
MESVIENINFYKSLMSNIARQFGSNCEVILHDFSNSEFENTVVEVQNGHVTGREVGNSPTNLFFESYKKNKDDAKPYITTTEDGKVIKSTTTHIRNKKGDIIGAICINFDISHLILAENAIKSISDYNLNNDKRETFTKNVTELLDQSLYECEQFIGKPPSLMTKEEKLKVLEFLDDNGIFLISKSSNRVCNFLGISKYTLYNYLDEIRSNK